LAARWAGHNSDTAARTAAPLAIRMSAKSAGEMSPAASAPRVSNELAANPTSAPMDNSNVRTA